MGGSLAMWSEYFVNAIRIIGIDNSVQDYLQTNIIKNVYTDIPESDVENKVRRALSLYENVEFLKIDAYSENTIQFLLENLGSEQFDIIIDDGSHNNNDARFVIDNYGKYLLKPGGLLVIEDCYPPLQNIPYKHECNVYFGAGTSDDYLIEIKKL